MKIWFGKHTGEELDALSSDYLRTLLKINVPSKGDKHRDDFLDLESEVESILAQREEEGEESA